MVTLALSWAGLGDQIVVGGVGWGGDGLNPASGSWGQLGGWFSIWGLEKH